MTIARPTSTTPAHIATALALQPHLWQPLVHYDPASRHYAQLASEPHFEAWLLTWLPGQGTDWHDHGGSAGAFRVLRGSLTEQQATERRDGTIGIHRRTTRLDTGVLRPFDSRHIHRVTNTDGGPAVSLHVYSPALLEMNAYEPRGEVLELVSAQLAGVNW